MINYVFPLPMNVRVLNECNKDSSSMMILHSWDKIKPICSSTISLDMSLDSSMEIKTISNFLDMLAIKFSTVFRYSELSP
jgi:hypothetical protein